MTQMKVELDSYSKRVLDVVKGVHGFKNRNEAFLQVISEVGKKYLPRDATLDHVDMILEDHKKKYGLKKMTEDELDRLLGL